MMVAPHGSGRDSDLAGIVVAAPDDGASALLINPAGVVSPARHEALLAIVPGSMKVSYDNPVSGYDKNGSKDVVTLGFWYGLGEIRGWSVGVGAYGSLGAAFNLPAAPEIGQTSRYLGEMGVMNFGLNAGRQLSPDLRIGFQFSPQYGMQKSRSPSPFGDIEFETQGFGLSAAAGLVYDVSDVLALGLSYRSPGIVKFDGDGYVGDVKQDVSVTLITPQRLTAGWAYHPSSQLRLLGQVAWTRYEDFERSEIEFEKTTPLDGKTIRKTSNRTRWGVAMEYELLPNHVFRAGFTQGKAMLADEAVTPTFYDHDNDMVMAGYEIDFGTWRLGFTTGYAWNEDREISVGENPNFPGTYESNIPVSVGVRFIRELDH